MKIKLNYDQIFKEFNENLVSKLRKHGSENAYLSLWVPNEDFFKSFKSLYFSLKDNGVESFDIEVNKKNFTNSSKKSIESFFKNLDVVDMNDSYLLSINKIIYTNKEQKIIDQVRKNNFNQNKYNYGQTFNNSTKNKIKYYLLNVYKDLSKKKPQLFENSKTVSLKITDINVDFEQSEEGLFRHLNIVTKNKYLLGMQFLFNKIFFGQKVDNILRYGLDELIEHLTEITKSKVDGINLPTNFGDEVYFIHNVLKKICNENIFQNRSSIKKEKMAWISLSEKSRINYCKQSIVKFNTQNENTSSIIFDYLEDDLNGHPMRIFVNVDGELTSTEKSNLIRDLEKFVKHNLVRGLQILYQEKKDLSKIRRL